MNKKPKPHIEDLKSNLERAFTNGREHCDFQYATRDDGGEEGGYLLRSRDFAAGLALLDDLVQHDRFASLTSLKQTRHALQNYRSMLDQDCYVLTARQIAKLIAEVDAVGQAEFAS